MRLVEFRCKARGCDGRLLGWLESAPSNEISWAGMVLVPICQRHGGAHGSGDAWRVRQARAGQPTDRVENGGKWIYWSELRSKVEEARDTERTQVHWL